MLGFPAPSGILKGKDLDAALKERKLLAANCILCRVLLCIVAHCNKSVLSDELAEKLEDMVGSRCNQGFWPN